DAWAECRRSNSHKTYCDTCSGPSLRADHPPAWGAQRAWRTLKVRDSWRSSGADRPGRVPVGSAHVKRCDGGGGRHRGDTEGAEFLRYLRTERGLRLREIAALLQKSIAYVSRRLGVFGSPALEEAVRADRITQAAAQEILRAPEDQWSALAERAAGLTRAQV